MFKHKWSQFLFALTTAICLTAILSSISSFAYATPNANGTGATTASSTNIIYYSVSPAQAGLTRFTTLWIKGDSVNGICRHTMHLPKQYRSKNPLIIQQIAYNPATCSDLVREGSGPGIQSIKRQSQATVKPLGFSSSNGGCNGFYEIYTTWFDPVGINVSAVTTCAEDQSGPCTVGDEREWYTPSGWTEASHALDKYTSGSWCYGDTYEHMHNTPFCGGTDIYYNPSQFESDTAGDEDGNPYTSVSGCDSGLLHYTWQYDPGNNTGS